MICRLFIAGLLLLFGHTALAQYVVEICACCSAPVIQPASLSLSQVNSSTISGSFSLAASADGYLVIRSASPSPGQVPQNFIIYTSGNAFGSGQVVGNVTTGFFTASGLSVNTTWYFFIYAFKNCPEGRKYLTANPLTGSLTLTVPCTTPTAQATGLAFFNVTYNSIQGMFTPAQNVNEYLILVSESAVLSVMPSDGTVYLANAVLGNATVISSGNNTSFTATGLAANTTYYFYVFAFSNTSCTNGPKYFTPPLSGSQQTATPPASALNFYFGNLHAHSSYSDGNADDVTKTPADDYNFAKTALCFDFLGISEHNHQEAGMLLAKWQPGLAQASAATTTGFVALYGMEWGTISTGGHVVIYGMDSLIGWEPNNYQVFVAKGDYTGPNGLFPIINRNGHAFALLAHPDNTDYNNLMSGAFDSSAYKAIIGSAVENGPAFSTTVNYTNYPSSMAYLSYYRTMLAKGYKLGPSIDHDNHNLTFGKTAASRLVILATSLTKSNLLISAKNRRFYASQDCSARISYSINTMPMGSIITNTGAPVISVSSITSSPVTSLKVMYGTPGSGSVAVQLTSVSTGSLSYTDNALTAGNTRYYYLDITEADGKRIITSPVWYTRQ